MNAPIKMAVMLTLVAISLGATAPYPAAAGPDIIVTIDNFTFSPATIAIRSGTTVIWTNHDDIPHTVTASETPRLFKSDPLDTNDRYAYRFGKPGRFAYFCSLHPHMQGLIVVK